MSNSKLVDYTKISPNKTSPRNHKIDTITIHCVVGQCSVETLGNVFAPTSRRASSNYGIGYDGRIGLTIVAMGTPGVRPPQATTTGQSLLRLPVTPSTPTR